MSLRLKLVLVLVTVVIIAIGGTVLLVRLDTRVRVNEYLFRGGMMGWIPLWNPLNSTIPIQEVGMVYRLFLRLCRDDGIDDDARATRYAGYSRKMTRYR